MGVRIVFSPQLTKDVPLFLFLVLNNIIYRTKNNSPSQSIIINVASIFVIEMCGRVKKPVVVSYAKKKC